MPSRGWQQRIPHAEERRRRVSKHVPPFETAALRGLLRVRLRALC
jgi:hypothetical protein